ncbi:hypothetical protein NL676_010483 [Syzygium grande]|nr:hypothetical protein NL676_010483 [Syzygium grande]
MFRCQLFPVQMSAPDDPCHHCSSNLSNVENKMSRFLFHTSNNTLKPKPRPAPPPPWGGRNFNIGSTEFDSRDLHTRPVASTSHLGIRTPAATIGFNIGSAEFDSRDRHARPVALASHLGIRTPAATIGLVRNPRACRPGRKNRKAPGCFVTELSSFLRLVAGGSYDLIPATAAVSERSGMAAARVEAPPGLRRAGGRALPGLIGHLMDGGLHVIHALRQASRIRRVGGDVTPRLQVATAQSRRRQPPGCSVPVPSPAIFDSGPSPVKSF